MSKNENALTTAQSQNQLLLR